MTTWCKTRCHRGPDYIWGKATHLGSAARTRPSVGNVQLLKYLQRHSMSLQQLLRPLYWPPNLLPLFNRCFPIQGVFEGVLNTTRRARSRRTACIRQRFFPCTAGDLQGLPERILAPQRRLASIGPVSRG